MNIVDTIAEAATLLERYQHALALMNDIGLSYRWPEVNAMALRVQNLHGGLTEARRAIGDGGGDPEKISVVLQKLRDVMTCP